MNAMKTEANVEGTIHIHITAFVRTELLILTTVKLLLPILPPPAPNIRSNDIWKKVVIGVALVLEAQ